MGLKLVPIKIGDEGGIQWQRYNEGLRWSGTNDIVYYMAVTHLLEFNQMTEKAFTSISRYGTLSKWGSDHYEVDC
eukprot:12890872-Prorocentrum_lima.AAC.1